MEIFGEKKEPHFLLNAVHSIKRNENEMMEEFNKKFRYIIAFMDDEFNPPDKSILVYYIEKLPTFRANNSISTSSHLRKFSKCLLSWCHDAVSQHDDVYMKLFALSLEEDACDWYINIADDSYNSWDSFRKGFMERFGEKKELVSY